jgi:hypothetical protein
VPWPVYSETFVRNRVSESTVIYTVPAGKRAIITSIAAASYAVAGSSYNVQIEPQVLRAFTFQAPPAGDNVQLRAVAYAGERISAYCLGSGMFVTVSGYLLSDAQAHDDPFENLEIEFDDGAVPLPGRAA